MPQRLQNVLEDCNIKLDSVLSDIMGVSGRAMIQALITGDQHCTKPSRSGRLFQST
jgi:transposase